MTPLSDQVRAMHSSLKALLDDCANFGRYVENSLYHIDVERAAETLASIDLDQIIAAMEGNARRPYPELPSDEESKELLLRAERLWDDLQGNNIGGFSGINRPFFIFHELRRAIEDFGRRDLGLSWSKNDLDAALRQQEQKP